MVVSGDRRGLSDGRWSEVVSGGGQCGYVLESGGKVGRRILFSGHKFGLVVVSMVNCRYVW